MSEGITGFELLEAARSLVEARDREIEVLTTERDNALLRIDQLEASWGTLAETCANVMAERDAAWTRIEQLEAEMSSKLARAQAGEQIDFGGEAGTVETEVLF